ncbi:MAG: hypothetical protein KAY24_13500 [Candidatus Eisenbacteria sp.]|nr:hypothetical protein [Candidatus Eisenbacteria bacterium]
MHRSNILQGPHLASEPVKVFSGDLIWTDASGAMVSEADRERPVYTEHHLEEAQREARKQGWEEGLAEGQRQGSAEGREEGILQGRRDEQRNLQKQSETLQMIVAEILDERGRLLMSVRRDLIRLALLMTERIARRGLVLDEETVLRAIHEALEQVGASQQVVIHLSSEDLATAQTHVGEIEALIPQSARLELRADPSITRGGCLVDTHELHLDASVETLLDRFDEVLSDWTAAEASADQGHSEASADQGHSEASEKPAAPTGPDEPADPAEDGLDAT